MSNHQRKPTNNQGSPQIFPRRLDYHKENEGNNIGGGATEEEVKSKSDKCIAVSSAASEPVNICDKQCDEGTEDSLKKTLTAGGTGDVSVQKEASESKTVEASDSKSVGDGEPEDMEEESDPPTPRRYGKQRPHSNLPSFP